jgi:hypothetical protein
MKRLAEADPSNKPIRHDLAAACATLGDLSLQLADVAAARSYLAEYLVETRRRAADHAEDRSARRALTDALLRNGDLHLRLLELPTAATELREAHELALRSTVSEPNDQGSRMYLANALSMLAQLEIQQRDADAAEKHATAGIAEMRRAGEKGDAVLKAQVDAWVKEQEAVAAQCRLAQRAVADPSSAEKQPAEMIDELLDFAAFALWKSKGWESARPIVEKIAQRDPKDVVGLFLAARRTAAVAAALKSDDPLRKTLGDQVIVLLQAAHKLKAFANPVTAAQLEFAVDFEPLRTRPEFKTLLDEVRRNREAPSAKPPQAKPN